MWYNHSIWGMNCAFPCDKGERESKLEQGTWSMYSGSSIKIFGSSDVQFQLKTSYLTSRNRCCDVQNGYRTILEHSLTIWFDSGSMGDFKIIPIWARLMIALTSLYYVNSNKTNNIQSEHQHAIYITIQGRIFVSDKQIFWWNEIKEYIIPLTLTYEWQNFIKRLI